jgi:hypothetical protein
MSVFLAPYLIVGYGAVPPRKIGKKDHSFALGDQPLAVPSQ